MKFYFLVLAVLLIGCIQPPPPESTEEWIAVTIVIDNGTLSKTVMDEVIPGTTALEAFQKVAILHTRDYGNLGAYIDGVDGLMENAGGNGKFWQYYADGEYAKIGVSQYPIREPVTLVLKYESQQTQEFE
ncbi:DUF4430 domain-containing protein [Candidatus Micrarchaeota archaeon]|nr:DUF4430 domain-containing protein [Candidatus Micrarchaeota archaeon]